MKQLYIRPSLSAQNTRIGSYSFAEKFIKFIFASGRNALAIPAPNTSKPTQHQAGRPYLNYLVRPLELGRRSKVMGVPPLPSAQNNYNSQVQPGYAAYLKNLPRYFFKATSPTQVYPPLNHPATDSQPPRVSPVNILEPLPPEQGPHMMPLVTEELSKIASFVFSIAGEQMQFSDYTYTLLRVPANMPLATFHDLLTLVTPADQARLAPKWETLIAQGTELEEEAQLGQDTETIWLKIKAVIIKEAENHPQVMGTIQDISEFKVKEQQLLAQKEEAEQATEVKSEFVSLMSHEIRTPLNAILGLTYLLLQEENLDGKHKENLESIHFSSETLMALINSTLDYSRIEAGKIELEKINFPLREILTGVHRTLQHRAAEKNLDFILQIDPDTPDLVAGDSARLRQILNNLTSNAIKFTQSGRVTLAAQVLYESDQNYVLEFTVTDTGVGIPADKQEQIFESFVQASTATHRQYGGTGLGLAITKKIIQLHKGKIKLQSTLGQGSEFKVWLRYAKASPAHETAQVTELLPENFADLAGTKILVVDDNAMNKLVARKLLQRWQVAVETAENGVQALNKIKAQAFDLVLMDINMPVMNGFETIEAIRKFNPHLPIIALTASAREEEKNKVLALGGNDYMSKPFVPEELYYKLLNHLALNQPNQG